MYMMFFFQMIVASSACLFACTCVSPAGVWQVGRVVAMSSQAGEHRRGGLAQMRLKVTTIR